MKYFYSILTFKGECHGLLHTPLNTDIEHFPYTIARRDTKAHTAGIFLRRNNGLTCSTWVNHSWRSGSVLNKTVWYTAWPFTGTPWRLKTCTYHITRGVGEGVQVLSVADPWGGRSPQTACQLSQLGKTCYHTQFGGFKPHQNQQQPVDPSAAPPSVFRLARTKSGWRAGAPTKIRLAAAPNFSGGGGGGIRRQFVSVHIKGQIK